MSTTDNNIRKTTVIVQPDVTVVCAPKVVREPSEKKPWCKTEANGQFVCKPAPDTFKVVGQSCYIDERQGDQPKDGVIDRVVTINADGTQTSKEVEKDSPLHTADMLTPWLPRAHASFQLLRFATGKAITSALQQVNKRTVRFAVNAKTVVQRATQALQPTRADTFYGEPPTLPSNFVDGAQRMLVVARTTGTTVDHVRIQTWTGRNELFDISVSDPAFLGAPTAVTLQEHLFGGSDAVAQKN